MTEKDGKKPPKPGLKGAADVRTFVMEAARGAGATKKGMAAKKGGVAAAEEGDGRRKDGKVSATPSGIGSGAVKKSRGKAVVEEKQIAGLDQEVLTKIELLAEEHKKSPIAILLSGHSPFMGQTEDLDGYFLHLAMKRFNLKSRRDVKILFSPASHFPKDQENYASGFREYYANRLGVGVRVLKFHSFYYLEKIENLLAMTGYLAGTRPGSELSKMIISRIGTICLTWSIEMAEFLHHRLVAAGSGKEMETLRSISEEVRTSRPDQEVDFDALVFQPLLSSGHKEIDRVMSTLHEKRDHFLKEGRKEFARNSKFFSEVHGFYGGGGYTDWLMASYDYRIDGRCHWDLFLEAFKRGVPLLGYSAHAIVFSAHDHALIPYSPHTTSPGFVETLKNDYERVIPRKRDFFAIRPMKGLVPLSTIVHYERQVADLRKFELNYFDESVQEDVLSLRNNCAVVCFKADEQRTVILGLWSRVKPCIGDSTSEIRYISYETGKPCKLTHGEVRTISPNPSLPVI